VGEPCSWERMQFCRGSILDLDDLIYNLVKAEQAAKSGDEEWAKRHLEYAKSYFEEATKRGLIKDLHKRRLAEELDNMEKSLTARDLNRFISWAFLAQDTARKALYKYFSECLCGKSFD